MQTERIGDWIQTYSCVAFYPMDARPEEILIEDIAHSLSMQCRFGGHCNEFYSVAEHCCHMFDLTEKDKLWALLHDATEAYMVDLPRPVKNNLPDYKIMENKLMEVICERFGLNTIMPPHIKELDNQILVAEAISNMYNPWCKNFENPLNTLEFEFWSPKVAEIEFLTRYYSVQPL